MVSPGQAGLISRMAGIANADHMHVVALGKSNEQQASKVYAREGRARNDDVEPLPTPAPQPRLRSGNRRQGSGKTCVTAICLCKRLLFDRGRARRLAALSERLRRHCAMWGGMQQPNKPELNTFVQEQQLNSDAKHPQANSKVRRMIQISDRYKRTEQAAYDVQRRLRLPCKCRFLKITA